MTVVPTHLRTVANRDGAAVLDIRRGTISALNPTAAYVWQALDRGEIEEEIVLGLARETGESSEVIRQDVSDFLRTLRERKMLGH